MMHIVLFAAMVAPAAQSSGSGAKRVNKIVEVLASGKPVFGVFSGDKTPENAAVQAANEEADFIFYDMENGPFDVEGMRVFMQFMIDREAVAKSGSIANERPIVTRLPPIRDGRVEAQDRVKRLLDAGVYGIVFPHVVSKEDAELAVTSMRYRPKGKRPVERRSDAPRYWGMSDEAYRERADLWPANPEGELVNMLLIEDKVGVANAREIVGTEGVSIVFPGPGDLRRAYDGEAEAIENAIQTVLAACKEFDVVCGITAGPDDIEKRLDEGFRVIIVTRPEALAVGRRASGR